MMRQRRQQFRRCDRRVQEKSDAARYAARTQRGAERDEVIVVNPDRVGRFDKLREAVGEFRADPAIGGQRVAIEVEQM